LERADFCQSELINRLYVILETSLSSQSLALVLTTYTENKETQTEHKQTHNYATQTVAG